MLIGPMQTRARQNIGYGTNVAIILIILKGANFYHANSMFINE